jgi:hypothetical protein
MELGTRCGEGGGRSTGEDRATRQARGGKRGLTVGARRWWGREEQWHNGARSAVMCFYGWRHPQGGPTVGRSEGGGETCWRMVGDGSRAVFTETRRSAAVLSDTLARLGFSRGGGHTRTRGQGRRCVCGGGGVHAVLETSACQGEKKGVWAQRPTILKRSATWSSVGGGMGAATRWRGTWGAWRGARAALSAGSGPAAMLAGGACVVACDRR